MGKMFMEIDLLFLLSQGTLQKLNEFIKNLLLTKFIQLAPLNKAGIRWTVYTTISWQDIEVTLNFLEEKREDL